MLLIALDVPAQILIITHAGHRAIIAIAVEGGLLVSDGGEAIIFAPGVLD